MQKRNGDKTGPTGEDKVPVCIVCQMCGRKIKSDACVWQEDDGGAVYCRDCEAERDSCGCSD